MMAIAIGDRNSPPAPKAKALGAMPATIAIVVIVMEVNDNPNLEHGIEDQVGKDEIWVRLLKWFVERFEQ